MTHEQVLSLDSRDVSGPLVDHPAALVVELLDTYPVLDLDTSA